MTTNSPPPCSTSWPRWPRLPKPALGAPEQSMHTPPAPTRFWAPSRRACVNGAVPSRETALPTTPLYPGRHSLECDPAMISQPDALLAIQPAHLPHYTHSAVIVGSIVILAIITLTAGLTLAIAHHLGSAVPITHREQSPRVPCRGKHEMTGGYLNPTGTPRTSRSPGVRRAMSPPLPRPTTGGPSRYGRSSRQWTGPSGGESTTVRP